MSKLGNIGHRLYTGEVSYDFIGHRRRWYLVSAILIGVSNGTPRGRDTHLRGAAVVDHH